MTNLETMERGIDYTRYRYMNEMNDKMSPFELERHAVEYSSQVLFKNLCDPEGTPCLGYTRNGNLRSDMANLTHDAMKNEMLKNIVNVAVYQRINDTRAGNELGGVIRPGMSSEQVAVVLMNVMVAEGVEKGYEMLNDPNVLFSVCNSFGEYRKPGMREQMDNIARTNNVAIHMNNELDTYYARYGDRPKGVDTNSLDGYGYDANGGFSGFGRK